jgi:hypothetical protein
MEILMAIAISILILGAAAVFMYSAFSLLEQAQNDPGLEHQKLGVTSFLAYSFANALPDSSIPVNPNQGNSTTGNATAGAGTGGNATAGAGTGGNATGAASTSSGLSTALGGSNTTTSRAGTALAPTVNGIASATANLTGNATGGNSTSGNSTSGNSTSGNSTSGNSSADGSQDIAAANNQPSVIQKTTLVAWGWPPTVDQGMDPDLTWVASTDSPLIVWDNGPKVPVRCFLSFKANQGLELIWVPPYVPNDIEINPVRVTLLSALVVKMTYVYYDPNSSTWDTSDNAPKDPTSGSYVLPDYVQLVFDLNGKLSTMSVAIPAAQSGVPLY